MSRYDCFAGRVRYHHQKRVLADKQAVSLARAEARKRPRDVYWQWTVANCVSSLADYAGGRLTYQQNQEVIAEYKKTLQMLPAGHPYRRRIVETLVRLDLNFDDNGNPVKWNLKMLREALKNTTLR